MKVSNQALLARRSLLVGFGAAATAGLARRPVSDG